MHARRLAKHALVVLAALGIVAAIAVVVVIAATDIESYRLYIENKATALTGRELRIAGPLRLRLTTRLAIVAGDVRVANLAHGTYPELLRIERLTADIAVLSLLHGVVRIERLHLQGARLFLETDAAGVGNWALTPSARGADAVLPWRLEAAVNAVTLDDARIEYRHRRGARRYRVSLTRLAAAEHGAGRGYAIDARGAVEDQTLTLRLAIGADGTLKTLRSRVNVTLAATLPIGTMTADGTIDDALAVRDVDLHVTIRGDDLAVLVRHLDPTSPDIGPYELVGRLRGSRQQLSLRDVRFVAGRPGSGIVTASGEIRDIVRRRGAAFVVDAKIPDPEHWSTWLGAAAAWWPPTRIAGRLTQRPKGLRLDGLALTLGHTSFSGHVEVRLPRGPPRFSAILRSGNIDLSRIPADKATSLKTAFVRGFTSTKPLDRAWLRRVDADITLDADSVRLPKGRSLFRPSIRLRLQDGELTVAPLRAQLAPDTPTIAARVAVQENPRGIQTRVDIAGAALRLADLLALVGSPAKVEGAETQLDIRVRSAGRSPRELIAALDGDAKIIIGPGRFESDKVDFGARLLTRLLGMTRSKEERRAELICGAVHLPIRNGVVTIDRNIALSTSNVIIVASGIVDLRNERMEMYLYTRATEGVGLEAGKLTNMFKLHGAIDEPTVSVNPSGVVRGSLSIGAAVVTGGASLLFEGLARKAAADTDPCGTALRPSTAR